jgi:hypothetical protein
MVQSSFCAAVRERERERERERVDAKTPGPQRAFIFVTTDKRRPGNKAKVHRTYVERLERGESGVTVDSLAAILAPLGVSLSEFLCQL